MSRLRMSCGDLEDVAPELAFGLVAGPARAAAMEHLEGCPACRAALAERAQVADRMLAAGPDIEPPVGFESRAMSAIDHEASVVVRVPRHGWGRRRVWVGVGAAAVIVVVLAGVAVLGSQLGWIPGGDRARPAVATGAIRQAPMVTTAGRTVGRVVVSHQPDAVVLTVRGWSPPDGRITDVHVRLSMAGGASRDLGLLTNADLAHGWARVVATDTRQVTGVAMVDADGSVYCSATLT